MKTYVKVKADYKDELNKGEIYEILHLFETELYNSGIAIVIECSLKYEIYDSNFFV